MKDGLCERWFVSCTAMRHAAMRHAAMRYSKRDTCCVLVFRLLSANGTPTESLKANGTLEH